jgi:hypothetical protein
MMQACKGCKKSFSEAGYQRHLQQTGQQRCKVVYQEQLRDIADRLKNNDYAPDHVLQ